MATRVSVKDQPCDPVKEGRDGLNVSQYAASLAEFIAGCETPLTIGIQGEWGSGKTSLLNLIRHELGQREVSLGRGKPRASGTQAFRVVWINTWEHSLLKSPEECLLSILEEMIAEIAAIDGSHRTAETARRALRTLARGALRVGASMALGGAGAEMADELTAPSEGQNGVKALRASLDGIVKQVLNSQTSGVRRLVVCVDDLDRLEPTVAVHVLELLKNIFDIDGCVFVLAIDYHVVVKGLRGKFGEPTEENEWEFRAFFDKIIQLPFMMPVGKYDVHGYVKDLLTDIGFFSASETKEFDDRRLGDIVRNSIGHNPRSIKRLINALSLINLLHQRFPQTFFDDLARAGTPIRPVAYKELVFAAVCLQISYPRIYEILLRSPDFTGWEADFVAQHIPPGAHGAEAEVETALAQARAAFAEDFDEDWEQALFRIVWVNGWKRNRLVELSRLLSIVKDGILGPGTGDEPREALLRDVLGKTAVTAVVDSPETQGRQADTGGTSPEVIRRRREFWQRFAIALDGSGCAFDRRVQGIRSSHSGAALVRRLDRDRQEMGVLGVNPASPDRSVIFEVSLGSGPETAALLRHIRETCGPELERLCGAAPRYEIDERKPRQRILFRRPGAQALSLFEADPASRDGAIAWLAATLPTLERILRSHLAGFEGSAPAATPA